MEVSTEQIIKSKKRVQKHGEVFTPGWMVNKMLDAQKQWLPMFKTHKV